MRLWLGVVLTVTLVAGCGSDQSRIENDLVAATEIIQGPVALFEPTGKDEYGFVASRERTLDVFSVDEDGVARFGTFTEPTERGQLRFVRNPVSRGSLGSVLDESDFILVVLIPLLDLTHDFGIEFDAAFIGVDSDGNLVASDYDAADEEWLASLFTEGASRGVSAAEALADSARDLTGN